MTRSALSKFLHGCWHHLTQLALLVLILVAAYVDLGRQISAHIAEHKDELARLLSWQLGMQVHIAEMEGGWQGINADWRLHDVTLALPGRHWRYVMPEIEVEPQMLDSLLHLEPRLLVQVRGVDLHLRQADDGSWRVDEFAAMPASDPRRLRQLLNWLSRQPQLALDGRLQLAPRQGPPLSLSALQVRFYAAGLHHALHLQAQVRARGLHGDLDLRLHLRGALGSAQTATQLYLQLPAGDLAPWWPQQLYPALRVDSLRSSGLRLWWQHARAGQDEVRVEAQSVALNASYAGRPQTQLLSTRLHLDWQAQGDWQALGWGGGQVRWAHHVLLAGPTQVQWQGARWRLSTGHIALAPLLAAWREVSGQELPLDLAALAPQGWIDALSAVFEARQLLGLRARAHGLSWQTQGALPGLQGLSVELAADAREFEARLHLERGIYTDPQRFAQALSVEHGQAWVHGWRDADLGWQLDIRHLWLQNQDLALGGQVYIDTGPAQRLSLQLGLQRASAAAAWKYLPRDTLGQSTLDWTRAALQAGQVMHGSAAYEGSWATSVHGHLQIAMQLAQIRLHYDPAWPALDDLQAELRIDDDQVDIEHVQAHCVGNRIEEASAHIDAHGSEAWLHVQAPILSRVQAALYLVRNSPLQSSLATVVHTFNGHGPLRAQLQLDLPLRRLQPKVAVQLQLPGDDLTLPALHLPMQQVQGQLLYDSVAGLSGQLQGRVFEQTVHAQLSTQLQAHRQQVFHIALSSHTPVRALAKWWPSPLWESLNGSIPWQAQLLIWPGSSHADTLQWQSSLQGLASHLPVPLDKAAAEVLPLHFDSSLSLRRGFMSLSLGQRMALAMVEEGGQIKRAAIQLGGANVGWPVMNGIYIRGHVAHLDMDAWSALWHRLQSPVAAGAGSGLLLQRAMIDSDSLLYQGYELKHVRARLDRIAHAWDLQMNSDRLTGDLQIPDASSDQQPWLLHLRRLFLPLPHVATASVLTPSVTMPPLLVDIDALQLRGYPDSSVHARLHLSPGLWRADELRWTLPGLRLSAQMSWVPGQTSTLIGHLESDDLSQVFALLDSPPTLDAQKAVLDFDLAWPGAPWDGRLVDLQGKAQLLITQGRILSVSRTASVSRVVGLFSFADLGRRLKLDFSDLTEKGVAFDRFDASFHLAQHRAHVDGFHFKGPAVSAEGSGVLGLADHSVDMQMVVTVPVTRVLPLAAAVVAGPLIGGAVWAAQAVLSHPLAKLTSVHYHLGGSWSDPQVKLVGEGIKWPTMPDSGPQTP